MKTCVNCGEILGDNVNVCFNCNYNFKLKRVIDRNEISKQRIEAENQQKIALEIAEEKRLQREQQIKNNPQYEYKTVIINDLSDGTVDEELLQNTINEYSDNGWRLHSAFTSEIGKSSTGVTVGFLGTTINATIDQTVLIFERCIKM